MQLQQSIDPLPMDQVAFQSLFPQTMPDSHRVINPDTESILSECSKSTYPFFKLGYSHKVNRPWLSCLPSPASDVQTPKSL
jgi:hypothetical protein